MIFYVFVPDEINALKHSESDFISDDLLFAIQSQQSKIATTPEMFDVFCRDYPEYYRYAVKVRKIDVV